jgi:hypothetical protein
MFLDTFTIAVGGDVNVADGAVLNIGGGELTVEGALNNFGQLRQTLDASVVSTPVDFLHILNDAGNVQKHYGLRLTPTGGGMGDVEVRIDGNQTQCTNILADPLMTRCFDIRPTTESAATIRFYFTDAERNGQESDDLLVWHHDGMD